MPKSFYQQYPAVVRTQFFDLDNGAGVTVDEPAFNSGPTGAQIVRIYAQYGQATQTVAGGNFRVGTTVGGADVVASTAYTNSAAVGSITNATLLYDTIPPNTLVSVRHTGVAATQTGTATIVIEYVVL